MGAPLIPAPGRVGSSLGQIAIVFHADVMQAASGFGRCDVQESAGSRMLALLRALERHNFSQRVFEAG